MVLVILTEPDPEEAITRLTKRCAYVGLPISILFIKYFPQLGRAFDPWTGAPMNTRHHGQSRICLAWIFLLSGAFFFWHFLKVWRQEKSKERRNELILIGVFWCMIGWLFHEAHSATSVVAFLIAAALMVFLGLRWVNPREYWRLPAGGGGCRRCARRGIRDLSA